MKVLQKAHFGIEGDACTDADDIFALAREGLFNNIDNQARILCNLHPHGEIEEADPEVTLRAPAFAEPKKQCIGCVVRVRSGRILVDGIRIPCSSCS